jgi:uncharacterized protein (TIGR03067 family)
VRQLRKCLVLGLLLAGMGLHFGSPLRGAGGKEGDDTITAMQLMKDYADSAAGFDKKYKGKVITVEGVVALTAVKKNEGDKTTYLMMLAYTKPGTTEEYRVRIEESGPDFEGIRAGLKIRVRGTVGGHSELSIAAELTECKVLKVYADDYPPSKAVREEVKKLQGKWKVVSGEADGKKLTPKQVAFDAITFEGYSVTLHEGTKLYVFGVALDPGKTPKAIDLTGGKVLLPCVYALEGGKLQLVLPAAAKDGTFSRPPVVDSTKHMGLVVNAERQK